MFVTVSLCIFIDDKDIEMEFSSTSSASEEEETHEIQDIEDTEIVIPLPKKRKYIRGGHEIITEKLSVLLDRCNISDRDAIRIVSATAEALGQDPQKLAISRSTFRVRRQKFREKRVHIIKKRFKNVDLQGAVLHWDGKLLPNILSKENVERLAVLISCGDEEQLIGVPQMDNNKGCTQANAAFSEVKKWGAVEKIEAMCFDTTAVNTGRLNGTCVLLEQLFEKDLLYLACRHHISEVILKAVFDCKMGSTSGPQPDIFKRFQTGWSKIDQRKYKIGLDDEQVKFKVNNVEQISQFIAEQLQKPHHQPREDYKEFLQLCFIFLGRVAPGKVSFRAPGAMHHARWMAKAIYSLKIFIFRNQFSLNDSEIDVIRSICLFIINVYVKYWFNAPKATLAPNQDLQLFKTLLNYERIDGDISRVALSKLINHLWYLNPEQVAFAFFDNTLDKQIKINMAAKLLSFEQNNDSDDQLIDRSEANIQDERIVKAKIDLKEAHSFLDKDVDYFITPQTFNFYKRFNISTHFLHYDPDVWNKDVDFLKGQEIVKRLRVVNDTAERGVKLIQEYNKSITNDEEQKQYVLQVVSECRKLFPDTLKSTLTKPLPPT